MTIGRYITALQQSTRDELSNLLESCGKEYSVDVGGERETYVKVYVPSVDLRAWIYDDEASSTLLGNKSSTRGLTMLALTICSELLLSI